MTPLQDTKFRGDSAVRQEWAQCLLDEETTQTKDRTYKARAKCHNAKLPRGVSARRNPHALSPTWEPSPPKTGKV